MFAGKSICIVGGSGYVGSALAKRALDLGIRVSSVSRRGAPSQPSEQSEWQKKVNYVAADASQPQSFKDVLEESSGVIYTVGTLFDTTITKKAKPGDAGTYEQLNRDCAIKVADTLNSFASPKPMVYLSAEGHPPYVKRYLTTKEEAEAHILSLMPQVKGSILKPGFIYSASNRCWSYPLKFNVDAWSFVQKNLMKVVPANNLVGNTLQEFAVARSVKLEDVVDCAIYSCFNADAQGKRHFNADIENVAARLRAQIKSSK